MTLRVFDPKSSSAFRDLDLADIPHLARAAPVWIDIAGEAPATVEQVGAIFGFHPLAIEDARKRQQRPKVDTYPNHIFVVLYALDPLDNGDVAPIREVSVFMTRSAVVTLHREHVAELEIAAHRWKEHSEGELPEDVGMLFYTIADSIVDGYFPAMDDIGDRIEVLEAEMFEGGSTETMQAIFRLKRLMLDIRRAVAPTRDVFNAFTRREMPLLGDSSLAYYQDVYDHVIRVTETIDANRDILSSIVEVHLTLVSNRLNQTVRTLTVASIILMSLALIAGVYGMNFENMPELGWTYGYPMALGTMVFVAALLAFIFRRIHWL
jgi:magnesium transporter